MDTTTVVILLILGFLVVGLAAWVVFSHRRHTRRLAGLAETASAERQQWEMHLQQVVQEGTAAHLADVAAERREKEESQALVARYHQAYTASLKWEVGSRAKLLEMVSAHGLDGVLFSGVVFAAGGREQPKYVTQLDHVLLMDDRVIVIEAKNWKGVVFDGVAPSSVHAAFGALIDAGSDGEFAIQVRREDQGTGLSITRHPDPSGTSEKHSVAPRVQVRRQAFALRRLIEARTGEDLSIDACVFYSHKSVRLFTPRKGAPSRTPYTPVFDTAGMRAHLGALGPGRIGPGLIERLAPGLASMATDATGVGAYAEEWQSVLDAVQGEQVD